MPPKKPINASDIVRRKNASGMYMSDDASLREAADYFRYFYVDGSQSGEFDFGTQTRNCTNDPSNGYCNCGCLCEESNLSDGAWCSCDQSSYSNDFNPQPGISPMRPIDRRRRFRDRNDISTMHSSELKVLYKDWSLGRNISHHDTYKSYTTLLGAHWPPDHDKSRCKGINLDECIERILGLSHSSYSGVMNATINENSKQQFLDSWYWTTSDPCDYYGCSPKNCQNKHMKNFCDEGLPHLNCCSPKKIKDRLPTLQDRLRTQEDTYNHFRQRSGNFYNTRVIRHMSRLERETRTSDLFDSAMGRAWYKKYLNKIIEDGFASGTQICSPDNTCVTVNCQNVNCKIKDLHEALCDTWPDAFCSYDGFVEPDGYNPATAISSTPLRILPDEIGSGAVPITGNLYSHHPQWIRINLGGIDRTNKNLTISMVGSEMDARIYVFKDPNNIYFPYIESNLLASPDLIGWAKHCGGQGLNNSCDRGYAAPARPDWYHDNQVACTDAYNISDTWSRNPDCGELNPTSFGEEVQNDKINWTYPVYGTRLYDGSGAYQDCGCADVDLRALFNCTGEQACSNGLCEGMINCPQVTIPLNRFNIYSGIDAGIRNYIWIAIGAGMDSCNFANNINGILGQYGCSGEIEFPTCGNFQLHYWIHDNSAGEDNGGGGHDMMYHHIPT